jgi:hypothetical protein
MAPFVAALLKIGLPILAGAVQSKGAAVVQEKLGVDISSMLGTPEGMIKLKELEAAREEMLLKMAQEMDAQEYKYFETEIADRKSAREMQISALSQDDTFAKRFIYYFAMAWSGAALLYIFCITFIELPETAVRFADTILGFLLATIVSTIVQYFYGSSSGSKSKEDKNTALQMAITQYGKEGDR